MIRILATEPTKFGPSYSACVKTPSMFNGGEINFRFDDQEILKITRATSVTLFPTLKNHDAFFELALAVDAIRQINQNVDLVLMVGYFPYSRQDRVCNSGEAFGAKVYANMINAMNFHSVVVADPHSDVVCAALDHAYPLEQHNIIQNTQVELDSFIKTTKPVLISPDAGANKKLHKLAAAYGYESFIRADKARNIATGEITETIVYDPNDELINADCLIVDDLCDGGYTFIKLAEELKAHGANTVSLYVTHGIFSKGIMELLDNGIDKIYTTTSFGEMDDPSGLGLFVQETYYNIQEVL